MLDESELGVAAEVRDIFVTASCKVVNRYNPIAACKKRIGNV
jgi:hypothetical protein